MLFYESLFRGESHIFKSCVPILMILMTPLSLWYIWTIVKYIYIHWTVEFATILHAMQLYPALFMLFQCFSRVLSAMDVCPAHLKGYSHEERVLPKRLVRIHLCKHDVQCALHMSNCDRPQGRAWSVPSRYW